VAFGLGDGVEQAVGDGRKHLAYSFRGNIKLLCQSPLDLDRGWVTSEWVSEIGVLSPMYLAYRFYETS
jgi:hypothetical protein